MNDSSHEEAVTAGPLQGLRVLEVAGAGPAPFCGMLLSDLGADVVRLDRPAQVGGAPDPTDPMTSIVGGLLSRGRRSVALDLKDPAGITTAFELVARADVLLEGFRPGVMERLGLGPEECMARRPSLVYARMTGWGQEGPLSSAAGHDLNYVGLSGALAAIGVEGQAPVPPLNLIGDFGGGGMLLAFGVLAAVYEAGRSGHGQVVDAAMVDGSALLMTMMYELRDRGAWVERRGHNLNDGGAHFYRVYETADGRHVAVAAMEAKFYRQLLEGLGLADADLPEQWDRSQWPALTERFAGILLTRTRDEWCALFAGTDACLTPVLTMTEALEHPHNRHRGTFTEVAGVRQPSPAPRFSRTPSALLPGAPPEIGAHTDEVLQDWGVTETRPAPR